MAGGKDFFAGETTALAGVVLSVCRLMAAILSDPNNRRYEEFKKDPRKFSPKEVSMRRWQREREAEQKGREEIRELKTKEIDEELGIGIEG